MADETEPKFAIEPMPHEANACPAIYLNGLEIGLTLSDARVTGFIDGRRQCVIHMSFTTAKSLATGLSDAIRALEHRTDREIMTMAEIEKGMNKAGDR